MRVGYASRLNASASAVENKKGGKDVSQISAFAVLRRWIAAVICDSDSTRLCADPVSDVYAAGRIGKYRDCR